MTNEQILEQQVEALEKLLQLKEAVIGELEAKVQRLQNPMSSWGIAGQPVNIPSVWTYPTPGLTCPDGTYHQYPQTWGGTGPIPCTKCGAYSGAGGGTITIGGGMLGGAGGAGTYQTPQYQGGAQGAGGQGSNTGVVITSTGGHNGTLTVNASNGQMTHSTNLADNASNNNVGCVLSLVK